MYLHDELTGKEEHMNELELLSFANSLRIEKTGQREEIKTLENASEFLLNFGYTLEEE